MDSNTGATIAFIGFGEVGQTFARDLVQRGNVTVAVFDVLFNHRTRGPELQEKAAALGLRIAADDAAAGRGADVVISAVTASEVLEVATSAARFLAPGQVFLDVNSASPETKKRAAALVEATGADYVEGAVMAPVLAPGLQVPILAGGPQAAAASRRLNALGMNLTPVSEEHGRASAMKLCRSIVVKGLEAIMVDCAAATKAWNVEKEVYASLAGTWPSIDWAKLADQMGERVATHGIRRAAEMHEAADMVKDIGRDPALVRAIADAQQRGARPSGK